MLQNGDLSESRSVSCGSREIVIENQRGERPEVRNDKGARDCAAISEKAGRLTRTSKRLTCL